MTPALVTTHAGAQPPTTPTPNPPPKQVSASKRERGPRLSNEQKAWIEDQFTIAIEASENSHRKHGCGYMDVEWFEQALVDGIRNHNMFTEKTKAQALRTHIRNSL